MRHARSLTGPRDVIVCEAFVGNVILKLYEGVGATLISKVKTGMMADLRSKIGALLVKPALKTTLKAFDLEQYGGAPLLGLKGLVVKTHGSSKANEIKNSILQCHCLYGAADQRKDPGTCSVRKVCYADFSHTGEMPEMRHSSSRWKQ